MRIRASSKISEFAGEVTAVLHVHPNKCGKERQSWEAEKNEAEVHYNVDT